VDIAVCESTLVVDHISGTPGYICPVYFESGEVRESSEVFSFGVVLLELLVNKDAAALGPVGAIVYPLSEALQYMHLDPCKRSARVIDCLDLNAKWPLAIAGSVSQLALMCVGELMQRPPFLHIVRTLRHIATNSLVGLDASDLGTEGYGPHTIIPSGLIGASPIPSSFVASSSDFHTLLPHECTGPETTYMTIQPNISESIARSLGAAWSNVFSLSDNLGCIEPDSGEQLPEKNTSETHGKKSVAAQAPPAEMCAELETEPAALKMKCHRACSFKSSAWKHSL